MQPFTQRYAITFGEVALLHVGGVEIGNGIREKGFQVDELRDIATKINNSSDLAASAELINLTLKLPEELRHSNEAATLVIRNGAQLFCNGISDAADKLLEEQRAIEYDRKFWNARQKKTMNKRARYNTTFGEVSRSP